MSPKSSYFDGSESLVVYTRTRLLDSMTLCTIASLELEYEHLPWSWCLLEWKGEFLEPIRAILMLQYDRYIMTSSRLVCDVVVKKTVPRRNRQKLDGFGGSRDSWEKVRRRIKEKTWPAVWTGQCE
jgi:hypothetical protein